MPASLKIKGRGLAQLIAVAKKLGERPHVKVGVLQKGGKNSRPASDAEFTNAELMAIHEYGAPRAGIPARSVLRATADAQRQKWLVMLERVIRGAVAGKLDLLTALDLVGLKATADMVATIRRGVAPPLLPATIKAKGSSKPLIDTGRLVQSLGHEVVRSSR